MKSLGKIFTIIELLKKNKEMRLQEITNETGICKSTVYRLISQLCKYNYLEKKHETKKYKLGLKFLEISSYIIENLDIREIARDSIKELNDITKETIHLAMLSGDKVVYIYKKESAHIIRMYSQIGKVAPLYCTGVGKAILAFQSQDVLNRLLDSVEFYKYTRNTITDKKRLLNEIDIIKKSGYSTDNEEHEKGIACIAAPIWDHENKIVASVSITCLKYRMKFEELLKYKNIILEKSYEISKKLGYKEHLSG